MMEAARQEVRHRAGGRCEYCRFHESHLPLWPFHLDHVQAEQHGGGENPGNLAWSCQRCNLRKGTNLSGVDPDSAAVVQLFHPRQDAWAEHFALRDGRIEGLTPTGRATAWLLQMNAEERVTLRRLLAEAGRW
jgi:hypothetical protein